MLEVLDGAPEGSGARESGLDTLVTNLVIAESQHEAIEEQWLWPAVRNALDDGDELADQAIAQEQAGKVLLQRWRMAAPAIRTITMRYGSSSRPAASTSPTSRTWCGPASPRR